MLLLSSSSCLTIQEFLDTPVEELVRIPGLEAGKWTGGGLVGRWTGDYLEDEQIYEDGGLYDEEMDS